MLSSTPLLISFADYLFLDRELPGCRSACCLLALCGAAVAYVPPVLPEEEEEEDEEDGGTPPLSERHRSPHLALHSDEFRDAVDRKMSEWESLQKKAGVTFVRQRAGYDQQVLDTIDALESEWLDNYDDAILEQQDRWDWRRLDGPVPDEAVIAYDDGTLAPTGYHAYRASFGRHVSAMIFHFVTYYIKNHGLDWKAPGMEASRRLQGVAGLNTYFSIAADGFKRAFFSFDEDVEFAEQSVHDDFRIIVASTVERIRRAQADARDGLPRARGADVSRRSL